MSFGWPAARLIARIAVLFLVMPVWGNVAEAAGLVDETPLEVIYPGYETVDDPREDYFVKLLDLALSKTRDEGPYVLRPSPTPSVHSRSVILLRQAQPQLSVMWAGTTPELEQDLLPVRVPALRGLLGHRIFIVRRDRLDDFANVRSLEDLRRFTACQAEEWADTRILRAAGIKVLTPALYRTLFTMVDGGRCDFFPRSVQEPFAELERERTDHPDLVVEPTLLLRYPLPMYFFVAPMNPGLRDRLERGLRKALADGSWDAMMRGHRSTRTIWEEAGLSKRRVLDLANPLLTKETPLDDAALWRIPD